MEKDWVSFEEVKQAVSLESVISHYGIKLKRLNATTLRGRCPLPTHTSEKSRESFTVTLNKGVSGVWACQSNSCVAARGNHKGGNALDFVSVMEHCSVREAAVKLQAWFMVPNGTAKSALATPPLPPASPDRQDKEDQSSEEWGGPNKPLTFALQGINPHHPYLSSRGITPETAAAFGVGFFPGRGTMAGRLVFPIHNADGLLVAYAGRVVDNSEPKYKLPAGFRKSQELFNLHRAVTTGGDEVVVVEGFFDCLKVHLAGFPAVVALMGSSLSAIQEDLLAAHFKSVRLLLDGDEAGRGGALQAATRLVRRLYARVLDLPDGIQPDTIGQEDLKTLLAD